MLSLWACEEGGLLIETDISDKTLVLLAPGDGVEVASNVVFFDWAAVEDATTYEIQVATPDFDNPQQLVVNVTDTITSYEQQLNTGNYEWRVRAKNSNYETAYTTASFKVVQAANFSDNIVVLSAPANNLVTNVAGQNLQWQSIDGATLYRIQILENGTITDEQTTAATNLDVTFPEGSHTWQVRAENGTENTLYSSREILVDITNPNTPTLTKPVDEVVLTSGGVSFEWTRAAIQGSVEFDSIYVYRDVNLTDLAVKDRATSPFDATLVNDTYYWFTKAFDEAGNESPDSSVFSFTVNE